MPYIIITKRPLGADETLDHAMENDTHRAVATLDEAREAAKDVMLDCAMSADPGWPEGSNAANWQAAERLSESGGTIGPLPDGTVIEVDYKTWLEMLTLTNIVLVGQYPSPSEQTLILNAFNGAS